MKHLRFWAILLVCIGLVTVSLSGCSRGNADPSDYTLYTYDTEANAFVNVGCKLSVDEAKTSFGVSFMDIVHFYGEMQRVPTGYVLEIQSEVYEQAALALGNLTEEQKKTQSDEVKEIWDSFTSTREQVFFYNQYVFSSASIDLIRRVGDGSKSNYTSIEGYYESANDTDNIYLFRNGYVYGNVKDKDGNATFQEGNPVMNEVAGASYVLSDGFIILTRIDKEGAALLDAQGNPQRIVYLLASITYPADIADFVYTEDDYSETTKALAAQLAGKTVGLLTKTFYSTQNLAELKFY